MTSLSTATEASAILQLFEKIILLRIALQADKLCTLIRDFMTL